MEWQIRGGVLCATAAVIVGLAVASAEGQGFGWSKIDATLTRKLPPQIYLARTAISIRVEAQGPKSREAAPQMTSMLESGLCAKDRRLKLENARPETLILCTITQLTSDQHWEERKFTESQKAGERQEWNEKKKRQETKPIYRDVEVTRRFLVMRGSLSVSYQAKDVKSSSILDSENFSTHFSEEFLGGSGAPLLSDVDQRMTRAIVEEKIIPRLVPTYETVKVLLAKGQLKAASQLGEAGLWNKMVETLEMMAALKKPQDDAYRLFNIGVGYEALAYQAEDLLTTRGFLEKAAVHYGKAIEMKPSEGYFREPQIRIQTAIAQYRKLEDQIAGVTNGAKAVEEPREKGAAPPMGPASARLTNQTVMDLIKDGLDEANLIETVRIAPDVAFDLSPEALRSLLKAGVSNKVIAVMRVRQTGPTTAPRRPQPKRPSRRS
jgi:hypothetical protein